MIKQEDFMLEAIKEALKAKKKYEVPVGAIIVDNTKNIIARAHNLVETNNNPTCHAERLVIEKALKTKNTKYLKPESSLNVNTAQYLDADLAVNQSNTGRFYTQLRNTPSSSGLTTMRNGDGTSIYGAHIANNAVLPMYLAGDLRYKTVTTPINGPSTTTIKWNLLRTMPPQKYLSNMMKVLGNKEMSSFKKT